MLSRNVRAGAQEECQDINAVALVRINYVILALTLRTFDSYRTSFHRRPNPRMLEIILEKIDRSVRFV